MKKSSYLFLLIFALLIPACNDFHDNIQPADDLPLGAVYKTAADLESALNGVYNSLQSANLAGTTLYLIPELMCGNGTFVEPGFPDELDLANRTLRSSNYDATNFWTEAYNATNLANAVLGALPTVKDAALTQEVKDRIEGEALFIRGFLYFELVRYFGQPYGNNDPENGVPIVTEAVLQKGDLTFPARATVQQVYDLATADLTKAKDLLPASQPFDRANPNAATAMLARIAFQKGDYPQAAALVEALVENSSFTLTANPQDFFHDETAAETEMIWSLSFTPADPSGGLEFWFGESVGYTTISDELKAAFDSIATPAQKAAAEAEGLSIVDLRSTFPLVSADGNFTNKYEDVASGADDAPIARLAEFILMRAEALARAGDLPGGIDLLNQIRARSLRVRDANGNEPADKQSLVLFTLADFQNADALVEAIILERRVELCFEGNYFQDRIRLQRGIAGLPFDDCRLRLPIPQRELDVNINLKQNEPCY